MGERTLLSIQVIRASRVVLMGGGLHCTELTPESVLF